METSRREKLKYGSLILRYKTKVQYSPLKETHFPMQVLACRKNLFAAENFCPKMQNLGLKIPHFVKKIRAKLKL